MDTLETLQNLDAWRAALSQAETLSKRKDVVAVAVTGSLARGDLAGGSCVDLWVVGRREAQEAVTVDGVPVCLIWTSRARALTDDALLQFEVADIVPLFDPAGVLREVQDRAARRAQPLRGFLGEASAGFARWLIVEIGKHGPLEVPALRELAHRGAALAVFLERGWRAPRLRHFERVLPRESYERFLAILGLPKLGPASLALLKAAHRGQAPVPGMPLPEADLVERWLASGRAGDAALAIRQGLPPAPGARKMTATQRKLLAAVQGDLRRVDAASLAFEVFQLLDGLGLLDTLDVRDRLRELAFDARWSGRERRGVSRPPSRSPRSARAAP